MNPINKISLENNQDERHRIYFFRNQKFDSMTLAELDHRASVVAAHLTRLGVQKSDHIGIISRNCIEWVLLDLAILKCAAITAGLDAGRFEPVSAMDKFNLRLVFAELAQPRHPCVIDIKLVEQWSQDTCTVPFQPTHGGYGADDYCAIKFTSGSTGPAKGMKALVAGIDDSLTDVQQMFQHNSEDNILVFLRLAQLQQRYWHYSAMVFGHDITIASLDSVFEAANAIHPTVVMGVPGFFEDLMRLIEAQSNQATQSSEQLHCRIQSTLGGRIRYLWTGSAPASKATLDFYFSANIPLYQGYGLNETCIVSKNCPAANRIGSVGLVLSGKTIRFNEHGMIIVRSRHPLVKHYEWCAPDVNERVFLPSGEIATQDLGYLDQDGYLYITGRIDDILVLATGRNVLVRPIEERVAAHPDVHQCLLFGHGKPYLKAIISPATVPVNRAAIEAHVRIVNEQSFPEQRIGSLLIAGERFSIENGLLSAQFKPLRKEIAARYDAFLQSSDPKADSDGPWKAPYGQ